MTRERERRTILCTRRGIAEGIQPIQSLHSLTLATDHIHEPHRTLTDEGRHEDKEDQTTHHTDHIFASAQEIIGKGYQDKGIAKGSYRVDAKHTPTTTGIDLRPLSIVQ